ncbi:c-type cytochrome [Maritalea sp.]|uniref:c-type cytochrome n=1 Tax=Maritalea sp. TaxID=2003361 RepID=UPI003EF0CEED
MKLVHLALTGVLAATAFGSTALAQDFDPAAEREAAIAAGDVAKGEKVFKKCKACHKIGEKAKNGVGPQLNHFFAAEIGASEGFKYSKSFLEKKAEGQIWDVEALNEFLKRPKDYIAKTKMTFAGLKKEADRTNVIAYLASIQVAE